MAKFNWTEITKEDVLRAIKQFINDNPEYPEPRSTFLIFEDKKLPAKHIRGMAYKEHFGREISKSEFSGGLQTAKFFERLGFTVDYHGKEIKKPYVKKEKIAPSPVKEVQKPITEVPKKASQSNKIVIPSKNVIEQKNALQLFLNRMFDGDIVCEKTYPWLKTPSQLEGSYLQLFEALSSYRGDTTFAKKNVTLRCDFVCEGQKLIIEYDERQHFSQARKVALESYRDIPVLFDRDLWIKACKDICAKDNYPANRDEVRAYYDSVRDIACFENGYRLIRIMHGQIDFESPDAYQKLESLINANAQTSAINNFLTNSNLKVAMYLQTDELKNSKSFNEVLPVMKNSDADIIVFPEFCYVPFVSRLTNKDLLIKEDIDSIYDDCLAFSEELGKAVIVSSHDKYGSIYSVFANAFCSDSETATGIYIKHTMCDSSCLEYDIYSDIAKSLFSPILFKGYKIGMTICYDCNHALFSRLYGMQNVDLIINSTGGNVVYDKWFKYNKARSIENHCYNLVTMGGNGLVKNPHNYVFGFNKNGGKISPVNLCGDSTKQNNSGGLYVYTINKEDGKGETDNSNPFETENKKSHIRFKTGSSQMVLDECEKVSDSIYRKAVGNKNVFCFLVKNDDILKPEKIQKYLYSKEIKKFPNRRYVIINRYNSLDETFFKEKLSTILKVRAMENFCAVILETDSINKCYQCGKNRTAQVVRATDGYWGIDLERASGPEAIWKNKPGMKAGWRKNYEWLVNNAEDLAK